MSSPDVPRRDPVTLAGWRALSAQAQDALLYRLTPKERAAFQQGIVCWREGMTPDEIAKAAGLSARCLRAAFFRALTKTEWFLRK